MNKPDNNENSHDNTKNLLIKSFFGPFLQQIGQGMGWFMLLGIGLLLWQYIGGDGDGGIGPLPLIATGAGATTAAVLATMLETPLVVAVGVGILVWWIVQQAM